VLLRKEEISGFKFQYVTAEVSSLRGNPGFRSNPELLRMPWVVTGIYRRFAVHALAMTYFIRGAPGQLLQYSMLSLQTPLLRVLLNSD